MSTLTKLKQPVPMKTVQVSDEEGFNVRGLNPLAVFNLYYRHSGELGELFTKFVTMAQTGAQPDGEDVGTILLSLLQSSPLIVAELIALAGGATPDDEADWYASVAIAKDLAFPVQADALEKIGALTFTSEMPAGKFLALVVKHAQAVTSAVMPYLRA
jgi:hypothetical protein